MRRAQQDVSAGSLIDLDRYDMPGRGRGLIDVARRGYLLRLLVRKGTATRYRNSVLGWVWSYVKPAAQFVIYYFVMGIVLDLSGRVDNFAIYLFSGVVVVNLFNEAFGNSTSSIVENSSLVRKIYLPRELFPVAATIVALIHFIPQLIVLLIVCLFVGWVPTVTGLLAALGAIVLVIAFSLGLGLFFGALNVRYRDAQNFVELIRMFSTWTSPVLYTTELVRQALGGHEWAVFLYSVNPLTVAVELFHHAFWEGTVENQTTLLPNFWVSAVVAVVLCIVLLVVGQLVFRSFERTFAQDL